jgi:hypothetical protein
LADCGNLKFPDLNGTDFGEKNVTLTNFFRKNMEKIWYRGNFRPKIVIFETGCGNLP